MMKWMQEERGSVAVFLLVVLLPILLFEGAIFDGIRLVGSKSILTDAALNSLDSGLAGYDRDLKNAYGLYAVTDSAKAEQDVSRYFCRTVDPKGQGVDGADENATFFFNMSAKVHAGESKGSELSNREVFEGQIREYAKYYLNAEGTEQSYLTEGTDLLRSSYMLIRRKCLFDMEAYRVAMGETDSTGQLEAYFNEWKTEAENNRMAKRIEERVKKELADAEGLIEDLKAQLSAEPSDMDVPENGPDLSKQNDGPDLSEAKGDAVLILDGSDAVIEDEYGNPVPEEIPDAAEVERGEAKIRKLVARADTSSTGLYDFKASYPDGTPTAAPDWSDTGFLNYSTETELMEKTLDFLGGSTSLYGTAEKPGTGFSDGSDCIAFYGAGMFSSYTYLTKSVSGNNHFNGAVTDAIPYAEIEYILCGDPDPKKDVRLCMEEWKNYLVMWNLIEMFLMPEEQAEDVRTAEAEAEEMAGPAMGAIPFYKDLFLIGYACDHARTMRNRSHEGFGVSVNQITNKNDIRYIDFLHILLRRFAGSEKDICLDRMRTLIELNMKGSGHEDFSFDTSYTMLWIDAEVRVPTMLLPGKTFHFKEFAAY